MGEGDKELLQLYLEIQRWVKRTKTQSGIAEREKRRYKE